MPSTEINTRRLRFVALVLSVGLAAFAFASLPSGADAATSAPRPGAAPEFEQATAVLQGTDEEITYSVVNGLAVIEGDIVVGYHDEVQRNGLAHPTIAPAPNCPEGQACGVILTGNRRAWTNGVVPYTLAPGTSSRAAQAIQDAITEWENKTSIRFVARSNERDYVEFVGTGNGNSCSSWLGRAGGRQAINYAGTGQGCLVHEIGHAVGLSHEQNRNDRDDHINIDFANIIPGGESQFRKATRSTDVGQYDFNSVMHYSAYSFARDRSRPVITAKDGRDPRTIGGRNQLTQSDVQAVEFVYGATPPPPPSTTTTTAPTTTSAPSTTVRPTTTTAPSTTAPTTTTGPSTTAPPTSTTGPPSTTATTTPVTTTPSTAPSTTAGPTTTAPPPSTTATTIAPPSTTTTAPDPGGDRKPVVRFASVQDGQTIGLRVPYGGINVTAYDPDAGTADGDGIRWVTLVLSEAETGRLLGARREYWSTYDWGLWLRPDRSYTLTAYAVSDWSAGGGWSKTSITVHTGDTTPSTVVTTPPTTAPPTTAAPTTTAPTTAAPTTAAPTTTAPTTTTAPPTTAPPTTAGDPTNPDADIQRQVLDLTNAERAKAGCPPVTLDPVLNRVADDHTADMAAHGYFSHQGRDGSQPWDRVAAAGYQARGAGENIAQGYGSAAEVVAGWMSSPGHRRNMLDCDWTELGVGYTNGGRSGSQRVPAIYWAQVFAIPRG